MADGSKALVQTPSRPPRSNDELERMRAAHARRQERHAPVSVEAARMPDGSIAVDAPHDDRRGWLIRLADAVGSRSDDFALGQLQHLAAILPHDDQTPEAMLNALLAGVEAMRPDNEAEGALAVQMAATHHLAMTCLARASAAVTPQQLEANGNLATKMMRTYTTQVEALTKLRRGGQQKVTVEHIHVYQGGQALVGNVTTGGGGGQIENGRQPYGPGDPRAVGFTPVAPLLCQDAARDGMPVARDAGEETLPHPRRRGRKRGSEG